MENLITISKAKDNVLEFDVDVQGIETDDMSVRFIIEASGMVLGFESEKGANKKWSVKIPALAILDTISYPFHIDIIVGGYYFEPLRGAVNVVGNHEIYTSKPENITLSPGKPKLNDIIRATKPKEEPAKEEDVKPEDIPLIKPKDVKKFEMQPLKVKDGKELFKTLNDFKKPERKKDDQLDDKIVGLMKKAKDAKTTKDAEDKKAGEESVNKVKKIEPKKVKVKEESPKKVETKEESPKKVEAKQTDDKKDDDNKKSTARNIAENIIKSVTGLGKRDDAVVEKSKDDKIKDIIMSEKDTPSAYKRQQLEAKPALPTHATTIKKITKDKLVISVNETKEEDIKTVLKTIENEKEQNSKDVLKNVSEGKKPEEDTRTVTTTIPFKKKDITFH